MNIFKLSKTLDYNDLEHQEAGGFVSFIGKVRNHNNGREVLSLEYETFEELALAEGNKIIAEAKKQFDILEAQCIHRIGHLNIGDPAVWIGVAAAHRQQAFAACQFIIDELKKRVPIWKKEFYLEGDSGWIANKTPKDTDKHQFNQDHYYSRQIKLAEVGLEGQKKLQDAKVLIVGAGGLGSAVILYLAGAGIGKIGIYDADVVDISNLHRQVIYSIDDIGRSKAELAAKVIKNLNPSLKTEVYPSLLDEKARDIIEQYDLIIDCTDNFRTKFLLNDLAVALKKPLIQASIDKFEGQIHFYQPGSPCLRCLWPQIPEDGCVNTCSESGVIGSVAGFFGTLQANEAIKYILGLKTRLVEETLFFDMKTLEIMYLKREKNPDCPSCIHQQFSSYSSWEVKDVDLKDFILLDLREIEENPEPPEANLIWRHTPNNSFQISEIDDEKNHLLICKKGFRSAILAKKLREMGYNNVYSLIGGIDGYRKEL